MDEKDIIRTFLDMGVQVSSEALVLIKNNPGPIINEIKNTKPKPFIITRDYVSKILDSYKYDNKDTHTIKTFSIEKKPIKIEDYVKHFISRYEKMKDIILENKLEKLISINKINDNTTNFSIIGIVREKTTTSLILEDPTGEIEIFFEGLIKQKLSDIETDDIIGITCKKISGKYQAANIVFPDIPLNREIKKTKEDMKILVTNKEEKIDDAILIMPDKIERPTFEEIKNIKVLLVPKTFFKDIDQKINSDILQKILKKRHLYPLFLPNLSFGDDNMVIEEIPDIVISNLEPKIYKNYKGTTIISLPDSTSSFLINLKTREVQEIPNTLEQN